MTTIKPAKQTIAPKAVNTAEADATDVLESGGAADRKLATVTLDELAREMNMPPRDARMLLRLAAKQTKLYPTLSKEHVPRQPWQWTTGSMALEEARKALAVTT